MLELPQLQSFCSRFLRKLDVLSKQLDAKLATAQARYERSFDRAFQRVRELYTGHHVFNNRPATQMTES